MFLNDTQLRNDLESVERVVIGSPDIRTGWGEPEAKEERAVSPSGLLSLGNPEDEVEFVLSPTQPAVVEGGKRGKGVVGLGGGGGGLGAGKKVDERRDNPDRDGFAELEESGL
jgi:hypothetical protein